MANGDASNPEVVEPGKSLHTWTFPEFERYARGRVWYIVMSVIAGLALVWAIFTANFLFGLILLMASTLYVFRLRRPPQLLTCAIAENGITAGLHFLPYRSLRDFWIIYRPPTVKRLYLRPKSALRPLLVVPLENQNPLVIRESLRRHLPEDVSQEEEPTLDQISRTLRI